MSRYYSMFSAGQGSFRASMIARKRNPESELYLLFNDTLYEDADAYRFLIEGAAMVYGRRLNWTVKAEDFPDYRVADDVPIEEYRGNPEWRAFLSDLRLRAINAIPELIWLVEGRDPWEVFRDSRFLGNTTVDPCSLILKREITDNWKMGHCWRTGELFADPDVFIYGIGDHERHRFDDGEGGGLRPRFEREGWIAEAPLLTEPRDGEYSLFYAPLDNLGIETPRLYRSGYKHNNCGGFCCKAGQAHWANRFRVQPERYAYDAMMERKIAEHLGSNVSMLRDRRGGETKPLTLVEFAERLQADPEVKFEYQPGDSGCACMVTA